MPFSSGSIFGPRFFDLYIDDKRNDIGCAIILYADDTKLVILKNNNFIQEIALLRTWSSESHLTITQTIGEILVPKRRSFDYLWNCYVYQWSWIYELKKFSTANSYLSLISKWTTFLISDAKRFFFASRSPKIKVPETHIFFRMLYSVPVWIVLVAKLRKLLAFQKNLWKGPLGTRITNFSFVHQFLYLSATIPSLDNGYSSAKFSTVSSNQRYQNTFIINFFLYHVALNDNFGLKQQNNSNQIWEKNVSSVSPAKLPTNNQKRDWIYLSMLQLWKFFSPTNGFSLQWTSIKHLDSRLWLQSLKCL